MENAQSYAKLEQLEASIKVSQNSSKTAGIAKVKERVELQQELGQLRYARHFLQERYVALAKTDEAERAKLQAHAEKMWKSIEALSMD